MLPCVFVALHGFAYFDRIATQSLLHWWKPQPIAGNLFISNEEHLRNYVTAIIHLNDDSANVCGIVSSNLDVFVVAIQEEECQLRACLWQPETERVKTFRSLRSWFEERDIEHTTILTGVDHDQWVISSLAP